MMTTLSWRSLNSAAPSWLCWPCTRGREREPSSGSGGRGHSICDSLAHEQVPVGLLYRVLTCWIPLLTWMILVRTVSNADQPAGSSRRTLVLVLSFILLLTTASLSCWASAIRGLFLP